MTTRHPYNAMEVMNSIREFYSRHELEDFVIDVNKNEIKCHRFILASCSEFFSGLFRSGMKEVTDGRATLHGISCETFKLILEALYTGIDVVTEDNAIAIWHASNQLQIYFMIRLCENMVVKMLSLDNFEEVYKAAKLIDSKYVLGFIKTFILEHFILLRKMNTFLELSYDELLALISNDKLVVESEDQVLESIMEWIEYPDIEKLEDEHQNDKRTCAEDFRERSQVIVQNAVETDSFVNNNLSAESGVSINPCTSDNNVTILDTDDDADEKGVCRPQLYQAKDLSTDESNKEVSPKQGHDKTVSTVTTMLDPTNDPLQQLKHAKRQFVGERQSKLVPLLTAVRTCLASPSFVENLYNHHLFKENYKAKDILFNAVLHHTKKYQNGACSKMALHRECSEFGNFVVFYEGIFKAYSIAKNDYYGIKCFPDYQYIHFNQLVFFDNELYACGQRSRKANKSKLFLFRNNNWTNVTVIIGSWLFLLSYENSIMVLNLERKIISLLKPGKSYKLEENFASLPENGTFEYAQICYNKLLVFLAENVEGIEETTVHCLDLLSKIWTRLDNLKGPAKQLFSFQDDENNYIIQRNGNVWRLLNTKDKLVSFHFIGKLWTCDRVLYGAVLYKNRLILCVDDSDNYSKDTQFVYKDFPYSLQMWRVKDPGSNFLPVILLKSCLIPLRK